MLGMQNKTGVWLEKCSAVKGPALFGQHHEAPRGADGMEVIAASPMAGGGVEVMGWMTAGPRQVMGWR